MRFCGACGRFLSRYPEQRERRRVSVAFIDLAGFSRITHDFDPEEVRDLADDMLSAVTKVIESFGGHVDAFRGDGLIALFGAPRSYPDDARRAVLAADAALRTIEQLGEGKKYTLKGRAGVNTGVVIAGPVGSGRVKRYTVMGSAVNLAARLEENAEVGAVWVGPETYRLTRHSLRYAATATLTLRDFPEVSTAYRLLSAEALQVGDPHRDLRFVGRQKELALLLSHYRQVVSSGRPKMLWLTGEAGIGKTRLLSELTRRLRKQYGTAVMWVKSSMPTAELGSDQVWKQLARQLFKSHAIEDLYAQRARVEAKLRQLVSDEEAQRTILMSLDLLPRKESNSDELWQRRLASAWSELLMGVGRRVYPAVLTLVIDGPRGAGLERTLAQLMKSTPGMFVIRTSNDEVAARDATVLTLAPLSASESLELIEQLASPQLEVATRALVKQTGGLPAYVLELGRALSITPTSSFSDSLASLLQSRLDMLESAERQLLAHAALIGERCWEGILRVLAGDDIDQQLKVLVRDKLLVREAESSLPRDVEFRFQSELLRQAVLYMLPFGDRPAAHLTIARRLEQQAPLTLSSVIGYHFEQARAWESACPHYLAAAELAASEQQRQDAYDLYDHVLGLQIAPEHKAQAALSYVQSALDLADPSKVEVQLKAAKQWIEKCPHPGVQRELEQVREQLMAEYKIHRAPTDRRAG